MSTTVTPIIVETTNIVDLNRVALDLAARGYKLAGAATAVFDPTAGETGIGRLKYLLTMVKEEPDDDAR